MGSVEDKLDHLIEVVGEIKVSVATNATCIKAVSKSTEAAFSRGNKKFDDHEDRLRKVENRTWKHWVAIVLIATGAGSMFPSLLSKLLP